MKSIFHRLVGNKASSIRDPRRSARARLMVRALESRDVPAAFFVTNTNDSGPGSLRQAMLDANAASGDDDILFDTTTFATPQTIVLASALPASSNMVLKGTGANLVTISGNSSVLGFLVASNINLTLEDLAVTNCLNSGPGGGIYVNSNSNLTIRSSTISGNVATRGGGIYFWNGGSLLLQNSTISYNSASDSSGGGGIYFWGTVSSGGFSILNSTVSGNSTTGSGGGLQGKSVVGTVKIQNSSFTNNSAGLSGGGIAFPTSSSSVLAIQSSIVSGNSAGDGSQDILAGSVNANFSAIGVNSGFAFSASSGSNLPAGASLGLKPLGSYGGRTPTHAVQAWSPLLNAGINPVSLPFDQRGSGYPRTQGSATDIGAFETPPVTIVSPTGATFRVGTMDSFNVEVTGFSGATFSVLSGSLPSGLSLNSATGVLSGTPATGTGGIYNLVISAANGVSPDATQSFTLTVKEAPSITSGNVFNMMQGVAASMTVTALGYPAPTFAITSGSLPAGMSFNSTTGLINGTPAAGTAGQFNFTVTATNSVGSGSQPVQAQVFGTLLPNQRTGSGISKSGVSVRSSSVFAALKADGSISVWGNPNGGGAGAPTGTGFTQIYSTGGAFAALKADGSIVAWGGTEYGGTGGPTGTGFTRVFASEYSFAALKADGSITAWGSSSGGATGAPTDTGYTQIFSNGQAFVALKTDGSITAWGSPLAGGTGAPTGTGFTQVFSTNNAFAALKSDGSIAAWGSYFLGGFGAPTGTGFTQVFSTDFAFAALKTDGRIVAWGSDLSGGSGAPTGTGFTQINSTRSAFAALGSDGRLVSWGDPAYGSTGAPTATGFTQIFSTDHAFAAIKLDGSIAGWGGPADGGTGAPTGTGFSQLFSNSSAFAALKANGSIVAWGNSDFGGSGAPTGTGFTQIFSTGSAFAALKADASITAWGNSPNGGTGAPTGTGFRTIQSVKKFAPYFEPPQPTSWFIPVGSAFSQRVRVVSLDSVTYSVTAGSLPSGLALNTRNGTISGTPTAIGSYYFTIRAANGMSPNADQAFSMVVGTPPAITSANNTTFMVGTAGTFTITASGTPSPTFTVYAGSLPSGLSLNSATGVLSGTPATGTGGIYNLVISAANGVSPDATQSFTLTVKEAPSITSGNVFNMMQGVAASATVTALGYPAPTFAITSGALPAGMNFNSTTGLINGTPANGTAGQFNFTVTATNSNGTGSQVIQAQVFGSLLPNQRTGSGLGYSGVATSNYLAFAALKSDGSITSWGNAGYGGTGAPAGTGFTQIFTNASVFAALKSDGSISSWGYSANGGTGAPTGTGFTQITSTSTAFAALKLDGSITSWGNAFEGGTGAPTGTGFTKIFSSQLAFAALKSDGSITSWGSAGHGGTGATTNTGFRQIFSNQFAFAALNSDSTITAWGSALQGGTGAPTGTGFTQIFSNVHSFAALKSDGSITTWGDPSFGGSGAPTGSGFTRVVSNTYAFTALKSDGSITAWGSPGYGGTGAPTSTGFTQVFSTGSAFAALKSDGSITTWGDPSYGGSGAPTGSGFTRVFSNPYAFTALKSDGSITAWGRADTGGTGAPTGTGFTQIFSNNAAFTALKSDGSITVWGDPVYGGTGAPTGTGFRTIQSVKNFAPYFEPPQPTSFSATVGSAFSQMIRVVSLDTVTYSVTAGSLPAGLTLNSNTGAITGTPTVGGTFNFTIQAANGVSPNATQAFSMAVNQVPAPTVAQVKVNDGSIQRSMVKSLTVTFNSVVSFAGSVANAFQLSRQGGGNVGGFTATVNVVNGVTVVTLSNFTGAQTQFGSLANGFYNLTVLASQVSNAGGAMASNYTLVGNSTNKFFRYYGDLDGNASVDGDDLAIFVSTLFNPGNYVAALDYDNNGSIDGDDLALFVQNLFVPL